MIIWGKSFTTHVTEKKLISTHKILLDFDKMKTINIKVHQSQKMK